MGFSSALLSYLKSYVQGTECRAPLHPVSTPPWIMGLIKSAACQSGLDRCVFGGLFLIWGPCCQKGTLQVNLLPRSNLDPNWQATRLCAAAVVLG